MHACINAHPSAAACRYFLTIYTTLRLINGTAAILSSPLMVMFADEQQDGALGLAWR